MAYTYSEKDGMVKIVDEKEIEVVENIDNVENDETIEIVNKFEPIEEEPKGKK